MKITDFALENRTSIFVMMLIIAIMGVFSYMTLPRESAPDIAISYVWVNSYYEGVSPSDMETLVTLKIEKELKSVKDVKEIQSSSIESFSTIMVEFNPNVDINDAMQRVREKVDRAKPELPADMEDEPTVTEINFSELPIILVNIVGDKNQIRMKEIADRLEEKIEGISGVLKVDVTGALEREIRLEFDSDRMAAYNIDPQQAIAAVAQNNLNVPSGSLELGEANYSVKIPGEFKDPDEIDNIVISVHNGKPVYLLDVAKVVDGFKERDSYARLNGEPVVTLAVSKSSGENILRIIRDVKALIKTAEPMLPAGVEFVISADSSEDINLLVHDLENNFLSGLILVMIVVFFALGKRDALLVSVAIPFSMMLAFIVLSAMGITLNFIVLFSLTLSLGMLVDNAIVIVENIHRHHNTGLRRVAAARIATREVAWPITTSCLTTVSAFAPLLFWPGIMGEFMSYLPLTVIIILFASLFVALVINPCFAAVLLKKEVKEGHRPFSESWSARVYGAFLRGCIRHRWTTITTAFLLLFLMIFWFGKTGLGTEFFPEIEPSEAYINIKLPEGSSLEASDEVVRKVEAYAMEYPESESVVAKTGAGGDIFSGGGGQKTNESQITIEFVDREFRETPTTQIISELREKVATISGAEITVDKPDEGPPTGPPINLEISGDDFATIGELARQSRERIKGIEGVVDLKDDFIMGKPELEIKVDKEKAALLGLTTNMVGQMIRTAVQGTKAGVYRVGNDEYDVVVRLPKEQRTEVDTLKRLRIPNLYGAQVPLSSVADFEWTSGLGSIRRVDEKRTVTVSSDVAEGFNANAVLGQAMAAMNDFEMPAGYSWRFTGQNEEQNDSMVFLGRAFVTTILLIGLILVMQFDSIILPFIILSSVILSQIGVFLGLIVTGKPFGVIMTGIGVISLAGVVVNNSIVLIDYIEQLRKKGRVLMDAVVQACTIRLRPVLLTALTTILGLIPMATGISFNFREGKWDIGGEMSQYWGGMAVAVIFGLAVATLLTLGVVPTLYVILDKLRGDRHARIRQEREELEEAEKRLEKQHQEEEAEKEEKEEAATVAAMSQSASV
ncbi:MAG: efflux RND transporter permease subunit [Candidatus Sumerlaeia bacterium]